MSKDSMKPVRAEDIFYINDIIYSIRKCLMSLFAGDCISLWGSEKHMVVGNRSK